MNDFVTLLFADMAARGIKVANTWLGPQRPLPTARDYAVGSVKPGPGASPGNPKRGPIGGSSTGKGGQFGVPGVPKPQPGGSAGQGGSFGVLNDIVRRAQVAAGQGNGAELVSRVKPGPPPDAALRAADLGFAVGGMGGQPAQIGREQPIPAKPRQPFVLLPLGLSRGRGTTQQPAGFTGQWAVYGNDMGKRYTMPYGRYQRSVQRSNDAAAAAEANRQQGGYKTPAQRYAE